MTQDEIKKYRTIKKSLETTNKLLEKEYDKEVEVVSGKVKSSMAEHPYTEIRVGVEMYSPKEESERQRRIRMYEKEKQEKEEYICRAIDFINSIKDEEVKLILRMLYFEGKKQEEVAYELNLERSTISKKVSAYFKVSHNSQKSMI